MSSMLQRITERSRQLAQSQTFWTAIASVVALVALFRPELESALRRPELRLDVGSEIRIAQEAGHLFVAPFLRMENDGSTPLKLTKLELLLALEGGTTLLLEAENIFADKDATANYGFLPWLGLTLKPNDEWLRQVTFSAQRSTDDERRILALKQRVLAYWEDVGKLEKQGKTQIPDANDDLRKALLSEFERNFRLTRGSHQLYFGAYDESGKLVSVTAYAFVVFDEQLKYLRDSVSNLTTAKPRPIDENSPSRATIRITKGTSKSPKTEFEKLRGKVG